MRRELAVLVLVVLAVACNGGSNVRPQVTVGPGPFATPTAEPTSALPPVASCFERGPGDYVEEIERPAGTRSFRIHVPPDYDGRQYVPLLFNFHGQGRTALEQETYSGLVPVSDLNGFILVSPEGGLRQWNIVGLYAEDGIDDVSAVVAILEYLNSEFCIDQGAVFATGLSNGAEMAAQLGCVLPGLFAGVAPVAGVVFQGCTGPGVAVITFHGTDDFNVPYDSAPPAVAEWRKYNGCPEQGESIRVGLAVVRDAYFGCEGQPVVFYTLEGGGHTWPGAEDNAGGVGATNHEINASELIWEFFRYVRRE